MTRRWTVGRGWGARRLSVERPVSSALWRTGRYLFKPSPPHSNPNQTRPFVNNGGTSVYLTLSRTKTVWRKSAYTSVITNHLIHAQYINSNGQLSRQHYVYYHLYDGTCRVFSPVSTLYKPGWGVSSCQHRDGRTYIYISGQPVVEWHLKKNTSRPQN